MDNTFTEREDTYVFFRKEDDDVVEFVGPFFDNEIESMRDYLEDEGLYELEEMDEQVFRMMYPDTYKDIFNEQWSNFITTRLESIIFDEDIPEDLGLEINYEDDVILSDYLIVEKNEEDEDVLNICFSVGTSPKLIAIITQEIIKYTYGIFDIMICDDFYISKFSGDIFYSFEARMIHDMERDNLIMN